MPSSLFIYSSGHSRRARGSGKGMDMGENLTRKIIREHLVSGEMTPGQEIGLRIDQTLTQDATGTMAYLQFEAIGLPRVSTELSVSYVDHNMLQTDFRNADDHRYLQTVAAQLWPLLLAARQRHLPPGAPGALRRARARRCWAPIATRPPAAGSACWPSARAGWTWPWPWPGAPFYVPMPRVVLVRLTGALPPWVAAKDVILELLRRLTVKGGVGKVIEYGGPGVATLSVPAARHHHQHGRRAGRHHARSSPATSMTRALPGGAGARGGLAAAGRRRRTPTYDQVVEIDLAALEPLVAPPAQPRQRACPCARWRARRWTRCASAAAPTPRCMDLVTVAAMLQGQDGAPRRVADHQPRQQAGAEHDRPQRRAGRPGRRGRAHPGRRAAAPASAWARPRPAGRSRCAPSTATFEGRSGTADAGVYLASPKSAPPARAGGRHHRPARPGPAAGRSPCPSATLVGRQHDRRRRPPMARAVEIVRGPNIKPLPTRGPLEETIEGRAAAGGGRQHHHRPHHARGRRASCRCAPTCPR